MAGWMRSRVACGSDEGGGEQGGAVLECAGRQARTRMCHQSVYVRKLLFLFYLLAIGLSYFSVLSFSACVPPRHAASQLQVV